MIEIKDLSFGYKTHEMLFNQVTLDIKQGGICGFLGKNGAGKTTLLKIISGLIFPKQGRIEVLNKTPGRREPDFLSELYFLSENLFVPTLTIHQYVKFYSPFYPKFNAECLKKCLMEFDLPQQQLLTTFSQGQKKKFLLSFGLATQCRLLILDEPTNGLDIPSKIQFRKLLAASASEDKLFIISTHQVHDVENLIDSIVMLNNGEIIFHQSLMNVAKKLTFTQSAVEPLPHACLYYEKQLNGYTTVSINTDQQDSYLNLEVLFNAILLNQNKIQHLFHEGTL